MWIRNTSRYPDRKVRELVEFATRDIDMTGVCVNVKNGELAGGAYNGVPEMSNAPPAAEYLITLRLGNGRERWPLGPINYHFKTPEQTGPRNRFPFFVCLDWQEWLVKLAAHEAMHIEQVVDGAGVRFGLCRAAANGPRRGLVCGPRRAAGGRATGPGDQAALSTDGLREQTSMTR
jgi:hypothetical protein